MYSVSCDGQVSLFAIYVQAWLLFDYELICQVHYNHIASVTP